MRVERANCTSPIMNCVATIGSFDGVHRGHQCLLGQVRRIADERNLRAIAITFSTSPKRVLGMVEAPQLTTTEERTALLHQMGMDEVKVLDFTPQMAEMSARDFMQQVLREQLQVEVLVIGYDHRFGRGRAEGFDDYVRYGHEMGIEVVRGEACIEDGKPISSTRIRDLLTDGKVDEATHLLGYHYTLHGEVVGGYREGRKMGFPTANISPFDGQLTTDNRQQTADKACACKLIPADGVYAVWVNVNDNENDDENRPAGWKSSSSSLSSFLGMLNIGYRPTLNNGRERSIEVHILDFEGDLYGKTITVKFAQRLRDERTFASLEELTEQLQKDRERVRMLLVAEQ